MKKLGIALLAAAIGLPVFAAQTGSPQAPTTQSGKKVHKMKHKKHGKKHAGSTTTSTPSK